MDVTFSCPLGTEAWVRTIAERMRLGYTLNPRGRPRLETSGEE